MFDFKKPKKFNIIFDHRLYRVKFEHIIRNSLACLTCRKIYIL